MFVHHCYYGNHHHHRHHLKADLGNEGEWDGEQLISPNWIHYYFSGFPLPYTWSWWWLLCWWGFVTFFLATLLFGAGVCKWNSINMNRHTISTIKIIRSVLKDSMCIKHQKTGQNCWKPFSLLSSISNYFPTLLLQGRTSKCLESLLLWDLFVGKCQHFRGLGCYQSRALLFKRLACKFCPCR